MHPDVVASKPGTCPRCGMPLVASAPSPERAAYRLDLETVPRAVRAGEKIELRFRISHPGTGAPVTKLEIVHEMPFHLFVVSRDLAHFAHIHPMPQDDGSFAVETVLPEAGSYALYADFFPADGTPQVIERDLATSDAPSAGPPPLSAAPRVENGRVDESAGGLRAEVRVDPPRPVAGRTAVLDFRLVDAEDGRPVSDLEPYLGAWGHAVALREDGSDFAHLHASAAVRSSRGVPSPPAELRFPAYFRRPGRHRVWSEFRRREGLVTISFDLPVGRLERVARWDGGGWTSPGSTDNPSGSFDGAVRALAADGSGLYAGGDFTSVDGVRANGVARWDGRRWSNLGEGVDGRVWAIAARGGQLYVGGDFVSAGGRPAAGIARWDGRRWSALGGGVGGRRDAAGEPTVYALVWSGETLYAGGRFATAGAVAAKGVAAWDGRRWKPLGSGVASGMYDGVVRALAARGTIVYAGGRFLSAGGVPAYNVARWNGRAWSALGSGVRGNLEEVLALALDGDALYAGGRFGEAGGVPAPNVAKWEGGAWSSLPIRAPDGVWAIASEAGRTLVAGAGFALPDGRRVNGIVQVGAGGWAPLGGALGEGAYSGPVMAIAARERAIYVGGDLFTLPPGSDAAGEAAR